MLSQTGEIATKCWLEIPIHFPNVRLDEFVIMPDHVHGIVTILHHVGNANLRSLPHVVRSQPHAMRSIRRTISPDQHGSIHSKKITSDRSKMLLPIIIQNFKAAVTRENNKIPDGDFFAWQKSFYDHIIHSHKELFQMRKYVHENPIHETEEPLPIVGRI
jgi:REP element-mobilizing transposase RayT